MQSTTPHKKRLTQYPELSENYKLIKTIGKGNFAKVKSAKHIPTGKTVAIKIISKRKMSDSNLRKVQREISVLKPLCHPNIIQLFEVIESDNNFFIVTEYAPGGELFDHLVNNGRMKESVARKKFIQLISAIHYCHSQKIVHRDIKAENILLSEKDDIKLADFGFANYYSSLSKLNTYCGSPPYAAPELFQAKKYTGPEVDVWSIGVILFTLVTGSLPFDGENISELRECVLAGKFRVPYYVSPECESLIRHMLTKNPEKRFTLEDVKLSKWFLDSKAPPEDLQQNNLELNGSNKGKIIKKYLEYAMTKSSSPKKVEASVREKKFDSDHATYLIAKTYDLTLTSKQHSQGVRNSILESTTTEEVPSPQQSKSRARTVSEVLNFRKKLNRRIKTDYEARDSVMPIENDLSNVPQVILKREPKPAIPQTSQSANQHLMKEDFNKMKIMTSPTNQLNSAGEKEPQSSSIVLNSKPRSLMLPFNIKKVKKKLTIEQIVGKFHDVLDQLNMTKTVVNDSKEFAVECRLTQADGTELIIQIEIFHLPGSYPYGFRSKRLKGTSINYKMILDTIYRELDMWKK